MKEQTCHPQKIIRREIHPTISVPGRESGREASGAIIDFVSSDETLDRFGEILVASGWRLDNYRKNPVVQNAHNYGDILFTIGRALITEVRGRTLFQRIEFATDINPVARIAYGLYKGRFLNAVSVGFYPIRWENGGPDSGFNRKYLEQELIEVSAVGIPANPNALQMALAEGAVEKSDLQEMVESLEEMLSRSAGCQPAVSPTSSRQTVRSSGRLRLGNRQDNRVTLGGPINDERVCGLETRDTADWKSALEFGSH